MTGYLDAADLPYQDSPVAGAARRYAVLNAATVDSDELRRHVVLVAAGLASSLHRPAEMLDVLSRLAIEQLRVGGLQPVDDWDSLARPWAHRAGQYGLPQRFARVKS